MEWFRRGGMDRQAACVMLLHGLSLASFYNGRTLLHCVMPMRFSLVIIISNNVGIQTISSRFRFSQICLSSLPWPAQSFQVIDSLRSRPKK